MPKFRAHEKYVQEFLGLDNTIASGNQFSDPSDGVHRAQSGRIFQLMVDCKVTNALSYRVDAKFLLEWYEKAMQFGKIFALPLRFEESPGQIPVTSDWILLSLQDFQEILQRAENSPRDPSESGVTSQQKDAVKFLDNMTQRVTDVKIRLKAMKALRIIKEAFDLT